MKVASRLLRGAKAILPLYRLENWKSLSNEEICVEIYKVYAAANLPLYSSKLDPSLNARFAYLFYKIDDPDSCVQASIAAIEALENPESKFFKDYSPDERMYLIVYAKYLSIWCKSETDKIEEIKALFSSLNLENIRQIYLDDFPLNSQFLTS